MDVCTRHARRVTVTHGWDPPTRPRVAHIPLHESPRMLGHTKVNTPSLPPQTIMSVQNKVSRRQRRVNLATTVVKTNWPHNNHWALSDRRVYELATVDSNTKATGNVSLIKFNQGSKLTARCKRCMVYAGGGRVPVTVCRVAKSL